MENHRPGSLPLSRTNDRPVTPENANMWADTETDALRSNGNSRQHLPVVLKNQSLRSAVNSREYFSVLYEKSDSKTQV